MSLASRAITDEAQLREIVGTPADLVVSKVADRLNALTRKFIERSPFVCIATARPDGGLDVSPRGDPAGFVRILDERTLLMPDRPGNRIADTLTNLLADDRIGLLFLNSSSCFALSSAAARASSALLGILNPSGGSAAAFAWVSTSSIFSLLPWYFV